MGADSRMVAMSNPADVPGVLRPLRGHTSSRAEDRGASDQHLLAAGPVRLPAALPPGAPGHGACCLRPAHGDPARGTHPADRAGSCIGVGKPSVSRQIAFLESIGLVLKEADPLDGRAQTIRLTPKGEEKMHQVQDARREVFRERLGEWPVEDLQAWPPTWPSSTPRTNAMGSPKTASPRDGMQATTARLEHDEGPRLLPEAFASVLSGWIRLLPGAGEQALGQLVVQFGVEVAVKVTAVALRRTPAARCPERQRLRPRPHGR